MDENQPTYQQHVPKSKWKKWFKLDWNKRALIGLVILILIVAGGIFAYLYSQKQDEVTLAQERIKKLSNPQEAARLQVKEITEKVGKLTVLPANETPTIATVSDASKLKNQAFFARAENGDKVLIYTQAKRAYLYRPSTNKIIEIAPIRIGSDSSNQQSNQ